MVKITDTKVYCDYCGTLIPTPEIHIIKTPWQKITYWTRFGILSSKIIGGHGCKQCYKSYKQWAKTRKKKGDTK